MRAPTPVACSFNPDCHSQPQPKQNISPIHFSKTTCHSLE